MNVEILNELMTEVQLANAYMALSEKEQKDFDDAYKIDATATKDALREKMYKG